MAGLILSHITFVDHIENSIAINTHVYMYQYYHSSRKTCLHRLLGCFVVVVVDLHDCSWGEPELCSSIDSDNRLL